MKRRAFARAGGRSRVIGLLLLLSVCGGCSQLRGRRRIQKANQLYRDGQYKEAVAMFQEAERFVPDFWVLWINKGYTCRQMLVPGAKTTENTAAAECALQAFTRLKRLKPSDPRGTALYEQTLFETDQYETLATMYRQRVEANATDEEALNGLIQVYAKWPDHVDEAIGWYRKKADLKPNDAEAQYAVGVFIWHQLFAHGGGADKASFDPRPDPNRKKEVKTPPPSAEGEIAGRRRIDLSDLGIKYLERAVEQRPRYHEAMTYLNLLYRQKSFAYLDDPDQWQGCVDKAAAWRDKSIQIAGKAPAPAASPDKIEDGPSSGSTAGQGSTGATNAGKR